MLHPAAPMCPPAAPPRSGGLPHNFHVRPPRVRAFRRALRRLGVGATLALAVTALRPYAARAQGSPAPSPAPGAPAAASAAPLTAAVRAAVVDSIGAQLARRYVDADTARRITAALRARLEAGAYDSVSAPARFAELVTRDMRSVNGDLHLGLRYDPRTAAAARARASGGGPSPRAPRPAAEPGAPRRVPPRAAGAPPADDPFFREAQQQNYGLTRVEVLPGNVGYLAIDGFVGAEGVDSVVADALRFLQRTDAIIIDVRRNGGGSGIMSHYVFSHFLPPQSVPTIRVVNRGEGDTTVMRSFEEVAGPRRPDVPLYVLTSQGTGSAAEEFSFVLKNLGRATIVGDRTAGAGHMVASVDVGHGFVAGVSITRVTDARSDKEWERVGVQPDVRVPAEEAREAAHAAALRTVAARTTDAERRTVLARRAETLDAQRRAERPDAGRLAGFAGTYDGERVVRFADGKLFYHRRAELLGDELVPLGRDRFALLGATWLTFDTSGGAARLLVDRPDGTTASYVRTATAAQVSASSR